MNLAEIYYKDDFTLAVPAFKVDGKIVPFVFIFKTYNCKYTASWVDGQETNLKRIPADDDEYILVKFDKHALRQGELTYEVIFSINDDAWKEGVKVQGAAGSTGVKLTKKGATVKYDDDNPFYMSFNAAHDIVEWTYEDFINSDVYKDIQELMTVVAGKGETAALNAVYAKEQADYSKAQGDYAKEQAENIAGQLAEIDDELDTLQEEISGNAAYIVSNSTDITSIKNTASFITVSNKQTANDVFAELYIKPELKQAGIYIDAAHRGNGVGDTLWVVNVRKSDGTSLLVQFSATSDNDTLLEADGCYLVVDWSKITPGTSQTFNAAINDYCYKLENWSTIFAHAKNLELHDEFVSGLEVANYYVSTEKKAVNLVVKELFLKPELKEEGVYIDAVHRGNGVDDHNWVANVRKADGTLLVGFQSDVEVAIMEKDGNYINVNWTLVEKGASKGLNAIISDFCYTLENNDTLYAFSQMVSKKKNHKILSEYKVQYDVDDFPGKTASTPFRAGYPKLLLTYDGLRWRHEKKMFTGVVNLIGGANTLTKSLSLDGDWTVSFFVSHVSGVATYVILRNSVKNSRIFTSPSTIALRDADADDTLTYNRAGLLRHIILKHRNNKLSAIVNGISVTGEIDTVGLGTIDELRLQGKGIVLRHFQDFNCSVSSVFSELLYNGGVPHKHNIDQTIYLPLSGAVYNTSNPLTINEKGGSTVNINSIDSFDLNVVSGAFCGLDWACQRSNTLYNVSFDAVSNTDDSGIKFQNAGDNSKRVDFVISSTLKHYSGLVNAGTVARFARDEAAAPNCQIQITNFRLVEAKCDHEYKRDNIYLGHIENIGARGVEDDIFLTNPSDNQVLFDVTHDEPYPHYQSGIKFPDSTINKSAVDQIYDNTLEGKSYNPVMTSTGLQWKNRTN